MGKFLLTRKLKILDQDGKIIHARLFQATAPTKRTDAQAYVTALDEAFGKLLSELLVWTTAALGGEPLPRRS